MEIKVCIDAGHGGKDPGALKSKRYEKDDTLKMALALGKVLKKNGVDVSYTRTEDTYSSPTQKAQIGNKLKADYFISIHRNASILTKANGVETLIYNKRGLKYTAAKAITNRLSVIGFTNRGVKTSKSLAVLKRTIMPAMLIEVGFISNTEDNALLDKNFEKIVNVIAEGFLKSVSLPYKAVKLN